jgi:predicted GNAT superfamily acetyltransferase
VTEAPPLDSASERATRAAQAAAKRAGVDVVEVGEVDVLRAVSELFATVWSTPDNPPLRADLLRALSHAGNYVAGAFSGRRLVGASAGFFDRRGGGLGLHSHVTAVLPDALGRSVGFALKQHQRAWALARGVEVVAWTFDPLVRRNAYFNLTKLGAEVAAYHADFYGLLADGVNAGDLTDRCEVAWRLASPRAVEAAEGHPSEPDVDDLLAGGAVVVLAEDAEGRPVPGDRAADVLLCQVPADIVALRASDPALARDWRLALRECLGEALGAGWKATGMTRSGWYVLNRAASEGVRGGRA